MCSKELSQSTQGIVTKVTVVVTKLRQKFLQQHQNCHINKLVVITTQAYGITQGVGHLSFPKTFTIVLHNMCHEAIRPVEVLNQDS